MIRNTRAGFCIYKVLQQKCKYSHPGDYTINLWPAGRVFTKSSRSQFVNTCAAWVMGTCQIDILINLSAQSLQNNNREVSHETQDSLTSAIIRTLLKGIAFACMGYAVSKAEVFALIFFLATIFRL